MQSTLSSKNQVVIPKNVREALGIKAGDKLIFVQQSDKVFMLQKPESFSVAIRGLAKSTYPKRYLEKERRSWD